VAAGVKAIAVEARRTLLLEKSTVERLCKEHGVSIHAV
jgi:DUF1009 family protein